MTPEQFSQIVATLRELGDNPYTITGAADWAIFAWMAGICQALLFGTLAIMWKDLRVSISAGETRWQKAIEDHERDLDKKCADNLMALRDFDQKQTKETDSIWQAIKDCQSDCCPRGKNA